MSIYDSLNKEQRKAVEHDRGPMLILAGAGSGKTRVLTHRIAYLIDERQVNPYQIMALTFTNKAAKEMRERVDNIVGYGSENIWVSTFHSSCVRILRRFVETLGYDRNFTIYDSDDQKTLMREVLKYLNIDTKQVKDRVFLNAISSAKDECISPEEFAIGARGDYNLEKISSVYTEYQKRLKANNAMDFDDLIVKTVELFQTNEEALNYYRKRFRYIMVDEYQDTNTAQFKLIHLLAEHTNEDGEIEKNLCVVGDDDQSIYKFRGANIRNILDFEKEYPDAVVIKLEQNYRSTKNILAAANEVIANNKGRKDKSLWTDNAEGEKVTFHQYENDYEEAASIVSSIQDIMKSESASYNDFAILYRTNAQSRVFEEKLVRANIPYKIIGNINFYQRKEIKDMLAYLKTVDNGLDSVAVKRIINVPKRGIGLTTLDRIDEYAARNATSFYEALREVDYIPGLTRSASKISSFVSLIEILKNKLTSPDYSLKALLEEILEATDYIEDLKTQDEESAEDRIGNINELINKITDYEQNCDDIPTLSGFLEEVALVADIDNMEDGSAHIVLMTLHSAKGLEFPYVYLCGMEENIFPSYMSITADHPEIEIEEERRLCYVGITRAMKRLFLSAARMRMVRGETQFNRPSRFLQEIPRYLVSMEPSKTSRYISENALPKSPVRNANIFTQKPAAASAARQFGNAGNTTLDFVVGDQVKHQKFGVGTVTAINKGGRDYEVTVDFGTQGIKKMLASFAKLVKVVN